jgi:mannose/fructose/sorbose-specific phosphotransferase system IIA component
MVGILIISHSTLGESLRDTAALIVGARENVAALALNKTDKVEHFSEKLKAAVGKLDTGEGVIIFADMFGGTPCNAAMALYHSNDKVKIVTGFNLPIVVEAIMHSAKPADEIVKSLIEKREKTILDAKSLFKKR